MSPNSMDLVDRRTLKLTGGAGVGALAGCLSTTDDGEDGSDGERRERRE